MGGGSSCQAFKFSRGRKSRRSRSKQGRRCSPRCGGRDIPSPQPAGGKGRCGKCRVKVNGVPRLACKTKAQDGDWIDLPETMRGVILTDTLTLPKAQAAARALAR